MKDCDLFLSDKWTTIHDSTISCARLIKGVWYDRYIEKRMLDLDKKMKGVPGKIKIVNDIAVFVFEGTLDH